MPIEFTIDVDHRLVISKALGILTFDEMLDYQQRVWSRPEVAGFNELIDMSAVEKIHEPSAAHIQQLATLSAAMDTGTPAAKFAIVAPEHLAFGLGRMYEAYRGTEALSTKEVGVFRTMEQALAFLGLAGLPRAGCEPDPRSAFLARTVRPKSMAANPGARRTTHPRRANSASLGSQPGSMAAVIGSEDDQLGEGPLTVRADCQYKRNQRSTLTPGMWFCSEKNHRTAHDDDSGYQGFSFPIVHSFRTSRNWQNSPAFRACYWLDPEAQTALLGPVRPVG